MKRNDPYTRIQRQQLWTLSFTIPLLTLVAIFQVVNPRNDLVIKVIFLVPSRAIFQRKENKEPELSFT